jgi:hypothetical protein
MEKRLQNDAAAIQESHLRGEMLSLYWIPSAENYADSLTKIPYMPNSVLRNLMRSNAISVTPTGWVHSTDTREFAVVDAHSSEKESASVDSMSDS